MGERKYYLDWLRAAVPKWLLGAALLLIAPGVVHAQQQVAGWPVTEGAPGGGRYSPLSEIDRGNVGKLEQAWVYRTGEDDYFDGRFPFFDDGSASETTPVVVAGRLIFTTPRNRVIALDPETGEEQWTFDPGLDQNQWYALWTNRGVAVWHGAEGEACSPRVFLGTIDGRLIALDAKTGERCPGFPDIDLREGVEPLVEPRDFTLTSPGTVVGDAIVVGSSVPDLIRADSPHGIVRAYDTRSGALLWRFDTIPAEGEAGSDTWESGTKDIGAANVWSTITADTERGLVFLPVSSASPDHNGISRIGSNLFSDSVVALDAATGEYVWHFQTVHHDLWDYDLAAPPLLVDVRRDGRDVPAVVVLTKTSLVFVLHRETGEPLFPVEERPVPASDVPGEEAWPTQPFPVAPPPLSSHRITAGDLFDHSPQHREACARRLAGLRNEGIFTPPSIDGTLVHPALGGGANWSGGAYDPQRRLLFIPVNNLAMEISLPPAILDPQTRASVDGEQELFAHDGLPCNRPPWGRLVAVDLDKGEIAWTVSTTTGEGDYGNSSYQPPLATAGGLVFHGGTWYPVLRIHDADTGERIGTLDLPAGVHGGAITYKLRPEGRQFIVVAAGGHHEVGSPKGDYVVAWALP